MMAVGTSALMAIVLDQPEADRCKSVLEEEPVLLISAGIVAEALIVAARHNLVEEMNRLIDGLGFEIVSVNIGLGTPDRRRLRAMGKRCAPRGSELWRLLFV